MNRVVRVGLIGVLALTACSSDGRDMRPPRADQNQSIAETTAPTTAAPVLESSTTEFVLTPTWLAGDTIPTENTCAGLDSPPALEWSGVPADAAALAIVVVDLDANGASGAPFVHWILANIAPSVTSLAAAGALDGTFETTNDFGTDAAPVVGWRGPCPPAGETHTYSFEIHALGQLLDFPNGSPAADVMAAIDATTVATATASGTVTGV